MHIQERTNTKNLTTCTKMTEEVDRRHGVNGDSSGKSVSEDGSGHSPAHTSGGRLKFFKDGKFILELVRGSAREGDRVGWVSVPRKTFWPPAAPAATPPSLPRAERAASLSVSDDNSSIQSSPWQRDHCWKQSNPRKNISKELTLYYCRPNTLLSSAIHVASRSKRRRPYDVTQLDTLVNGSKKSVTNGVYTDRNGDVDHVEGKSYKSEDAADSPQEDDNDRWKDFNREKYHYMKLKKPYQYHKLRVYKKTKKSMKRKDLIKIIDRMKEKIPTLPFPVNAKLANCKQEHMMVSPRKRILRELERVTLEDQNMKRRAKTVTTLSSASYLVSPAAAGPSHAPHRPPEPRPHNGITRRDQPTKSVSSYSISSLLSMPEDDAKRSPNTYTTLIKTESPSSVHSPDLSPSPDGYRYRHSSLALGSPAPRDSPTPPHELAARYRAGYAVPSSTYSRRSESAYSTPLYRPAAPREDWRDLYSYQPYAQYLPPPMYRAPAPLWMHYAMSPGIPPGPWAPLSNPLLTDHIPKEEPTSDLPLNLSKH